MINTKMLGTDFSLNYGCCTYRWFKCFIWNYVM